MIKRRNIKAVIAFFTIFVLVSVCLVLFGESNIDSLLKNKNEFLYNINSISAVIVGFSFTAVSILLSSINKKRIKRLWDNRYLDNLYYYSFINILCNSVMIILSLYIISLTHNNKYLKILFQVTIVLFIIGFLFFILSVIKLWKLFNRLKE